MSTADDSNAKERTLCFLSIPYNDFLSDGGKLMVNPLPAWARDGEVEIDRAVCDADTGSCCYQDSAAGGSRVTLNHDEAVQEGGLSWRRCSGAVT